MVANGWGPVTVSSGGGAEERAEWAEYDECSEPAEDALVAVRFTERRREEKVWFCLVCG